MRLADRKLGYDVAANYQGDDLEEAIAAACPEGVDIFFDNMGGPLLSPVLNHINNGARIIEDVDPSNLFQLVTNCAEIEGFLTRTKVDRNDEARSTLSDLLLKGQLLSFEYTYEGIKSCGQVFADLFAGKTTGKPRLKLLKMTNKKRNRYEFRFCE